MSDYEQKSGARKFVETVFKAEDDSAASLGERRLNKYSDIAIRMFHTNVLSTKEALWPAIGEFAAKMLRGLGAYKTMYYTDVLKLDMSYVTVILALISIYDVLNNPLMGIVYDHTRTRFGKARPWIFFTAVPYFATEIILYSGAVFLGDNIGNDRSKIIFLFVMLFIEETFSTIYSIPRDNMTSLQAPCPDDRIKVGLFQNYIGEIGSQLIYAIFLPLMELNNKGYIKLPLKYVYCIIATISATVGCVGNIGMALNCRERIVLQPKPAPFTKSIFYILKNKYMLRNFVASFVVGWWSSGGYSWDVVTQQEIFGGSIPSFIAYMPYNVIDTPSVALIPAFRKFFKNNNRNAYITLRLWDLVCAGLMGLFGIPNVDKKWLMVLIYGIFYGLNGLNNGPANVFSAEVGREINDYTEYVTGERPDGTIGIITGLLGNVTRPINAILTIILFKWTGYDTTIPKKPWSQGSKVVYQKVFFLFQCINLIPNVIQTIPYFFYDLVGEKREKMYVELNERRALLAKERNEEYEMLESLAEELKAEDTETN
ncbi:MAG: MFS transporter [Clostridia bacterium]|nr:MFS transporter [Clostridia bacterium]